ncbi:FkbM family methyltransferase [Conexibacter sp. W3-3-2]|uniref:FkbM family methyltransferase n=1 Tax=Conexibacter sp. W3-3-2 TaxID=2675227 RepID=UPI0012B6FA2F|nr:FkbM family methyltransferase [Conexibacter sp. W3-3-2]MTD43682.1 FkbM family methyltransferase [Conexibacter sp. W3-3-2]
MSSHREPDQSTHPSASDRSSEEHVRAKPRDASPAVVRRVTNGLRRRAFDALTRRQTVNPAAAASTLELWGNDYGGWVVPADEIDDDWICVCAGAGSDVSFESEILRRTGARVVSIDPFAVFAEQARNRVGESHRYSFRVAALTATDGPVTMTGRQDSVAGSVSAHGLHQGETFEIEGLTLPSLLAELEAPQAQLLKLDIEGSEYEVLGNADLAALGVRVLCVELHHTNGVRAGRALLRQLEAQGFTCVSRRGTDLTLVRR